MYQLNLQSASALLRELIQSIDLGRFGFKAPDDLDNFLKTPAGKTVLSLMIKDSLLQKSYREGLDWQAAEQQRLLQRVYAYWVMGLILDQETQDIEDALAYEEELIALQEKAKEYSWSESQQQGSAQKALEDAQAMYLSHLNNLQERQEAQESEGLNLKQELLHLETMENALSSQFDSMEKALMGLIPSSGQFHLDEKIASLDAEIEETGKALASLISAKQPYEKQLRTHEVKQVLRHVLKRFSELKPGQDDTSLSLPKLIAEQKLKEQERLQSLKTPVMELIKYNKACLDVTKNMVLNAQKLYERSKAPLTNPKLSEFRQRLIGGKPEEKPPNSKPTPNA